MRCFSSVFVTLFFCTSWLLDYGVNCKGHDSYKHQGQALTSASISPPHKCNLRESYEKILFMSEIRVKRTINKMKLLVALLLVEPNTSQKSDTLSPLNSITFNEF